MRNSELAKKFKARAQQNDEHTSLLSKGRPSSSDTTDAKSKPKNLAKSDEENDPYARFPFLAPFMVCQSPDISATATTDEKREIASPSSMNYLPARDHLGKKDYPVLNPEGETQTKQPGEQLRNIKIAIKPARVGNTSLVNSNSSPSLSSHSTPKRGHTQLQASTEPSNNFSQSSVADSSLNTCAPSSILIAGSTSATNSPGNTSDTSSLVVCASPTVMVAASTSATCPSIPPEPKRSPRSENKNLLRLLYDLDDRKDGRKNRGRANTSPKRPQGWKLSPFQKGRKSKKSGKKKETLAFPSSDELQMPRGSPVDLDEVSIDSYDDIDTEAGYYSDPTDADVRNPTYMYRERHTDTTLGTGRRVVTNRKCIDSEQVLSQLGMDVHEEDYCIEGEYGMSRYQHVNHKGHRRAGSGRWNYHQSKPSYVLGSSLDVGVSAAHRGKEKPQSQRRRGSKLGENIKESMKKIGSIIKLSDDEESEKDRGVRQQYRNTNDNIGSKVLSMLRGHHKGNAIPQSITITPTASEDPDINMTNDDMELVQRWQKARSRCREGQSSPGTNRNASPLAEKSTHKRNESGVLSIANSMISERTAHVDNRQTPERPAYRTDSSF